MNQEIHKSLWLIRVPPEVGSVWEKVMDNTAVAQITISKVHGNPAEPQLSMSLIENPQLDQAEIGDETASKAKASSQSADAIGIGAFGKYTLSSFAEGISVNSQNMLAISNSDNEPLGTVKRKYKAFPVRGKDYNEHIRRKEKLLKLSRQPIQLERAVNCYKPVANHENNVEYDKKKRSEGRKYRIDKDDLAQKLFELFEIHQYYSFKDLIKLTLQPATYLKEVLKEYCDFNTRKGPNRSLWELKTEYRHYESTDD